MPKNPHANFTPTLAGYSGISPFRFWCQTALPLTYDDSLSYYELLNKVVNYLNHTIEDLTNVENNTSKLAEAYEKLQKYVNDYFDDIDIKAELRNVLDGMAEDGTLDAILDPLVANRLPDVVENQISGVVAEQIGGAVEAQIDEVVGEQLPPLVDANIGEEVSDWLENNVDPVGSAVLVDSTLSISGAAADAKVTGDELSDLKTQLNETNNAVFDYFTPEINWVVGGVTQSGDNIGALNAVTYSIRPYNRTNLIPEDGTISCDSGYQIRIVKYNSSIPGHSTFVSMGAWSQEASVYAGEYILLMLRHENNSTTVITDGDIPELITHIIYDIKSSKIDNMQNEIEDNSDAISENSSDIEGNTQDITNIKNIVYKHIKPNINWVIGGINSTGALNSTQKWCIRPYNRAWLAPVNGTIGCDSGYQIRVVRYSNEIPGASTFVSDTGWTNEPQTVEAGEYVAPLIRYENDTSTVLENTSISSHIIFNFLTDYIVNYADSPYYRNIDSLSSDYNEWYVAHETEYSENFNRDTLYSEIISAFDSLSADSGGYLSTKVDLGGTGSYDANNNEYHLYEYTFSPKKYTTEFSDKTTPVFLINSTAHGFEKNAAYALYYFIKDLIKNWENDKALRSIRKDIQIKFIPVQNPWGFDRNDRLNANGVNLNRNYWNPQWDGGTQGTSDYGGSEPFSEKECQITRDWILNNPNAFFVIDLHTNGQYNSPEYSGANPFMPVSGLDDKYYNRLFNVGKNAINTETIMLPSEIGSYQFNDGTGIVTYAGLENIPYNKFMGRIQADEITLTQGHLNLWATLNNFLSITEELNQGLTDGTNVVLAKFSNPAFKCATEILGNCIIKIMQEYGE